MNKQHLKDEFKRVENPVRMEAQIMLPSGAFETIINTEDIDGKMNYYLAAYDDEMRLIAKPDIKMVGFKLSDGFTYGQAVEAVKSGQGMRLPHWSPDVVIRGQFPDEHSKMTAPYLYVESRFGRVPWIATMIELFAENWQVVA